MENLEINKKGPEFGNAFEPVKGVKHKKKMAIFRAAPFIASVGAAIITISAASTISAERVNLTGGGGSGGTGQIVHGTTVTPSPDPEESPTPEPEPEVSTSPSPEPETSTSPSPEPETSTSPTPETIYYPTVTTSPTPSPTPSEPQISFTPIVWESLGHAGISYSVSPNASTDVLTSFTVMTAEEDILFDESDLTATSGSFDTEIGLPEETDEPVSTAWQISYSLGYTLNGESGTLSDSTSVEPKTVTATTKGTKTECTNGEDISGDLVGFRDVTAEFDFLWTDDDRHDYDVRVTTVTLVWTSSSDMVLWDEIENAGEDNPVTSTPGDKKISFSINGLVDVRPPEEASGAENFYLRFDLAGVGTDKESSVDYPLVKPVVYQTPPIPLTLADSVKPTLTINHAYGWGEMNTPYGLNLAQLDYTITRGTAEYVKPSVTIDYKESPTNPDEPTWSEDYASGEDSFTFDNPHSIGGLSYASGGLTATVSVEYYLDGITMTLPAQTVDLPSPWKASLEISDAKVVRRDGALTVTGTVSIGKDSGDPVEYTANLGSALVRWKTGESSYELTDEDVNVSFGKSTISGSESTTFTVSGISPQDEYTVFKLELQTTGDEDASFGKLGDTNYPHLGGMYGISDDFTAPEYAEPYFLEDTDNFIYHPDPFYDDDEDEYFEYASLAFAVQLEDAAEQPGTAILYYREGDGEYAPVSGQEIDYDGDLAVGALWRPDPEAEFLDIIPELNGRWGAIDWMKIRFDYTFPDGSTGNEVYSPEVPYCMGHFINQTAVPGELGDDGFTVLFSVDTGLVDPGKITEATAWIRLYESEEYDGDYELSAGSVTVADDGTVTVSCSLDELESIISDSERPLEAGEQYPVIIELVYEDDTPTPYGISWTDAAISYFTATDPDAPTVTISGVSAWVEKDTVGALQMVEVKLSASAALDYDDFYVSIYIENADDEEEFAVWDLSEAEAAAFAAGETVTSHHDLSSYEALHCPNADSLRVTATLYYNTDSVPMSATSEEYSSVTVYNLGLDVTGEFNPDGVDGQSTVSGTAALVTVSGDPVTYSGTLTSVSLAWKTDDNPTPSPTVSGSFYEEGTGLVNSTDIAEGQEVSYIFTFSSGAIPSDATEFIVWIDGTAVGNDEITYQGGIHGTATGSVSLPTVTDPLGDLDVSYTAGVIFGGSAPLLNGVKEGDLTSYEFAVFQDPDGDNLDVTSELGINDHINSEGHSDYDWIGFEYLDDAVPTLAPGATYEVTVTAVFAGKDYSSSDRFTVPDDSDALNVQAYYHPDGNNNELYVFNLAEMPDALSVDADVWVDIGGIGDSNYDEASVSLESVQLVWTINGAEDTRSFTPADDVEFSYEPDYHAYTASVTGPAEIPTGATNVKLLVNVSAEHTDGRTGSATAESNNYDLVVAQNPFGAGQFQYYVNDMQLKGKLYLAAAANPDYMLNTRFELFADGETVDDDITSDIEFLSDDGGNYISLRYSAELNSDYDYSIVCHATYMDLEVESSEFDVDFAENPFSEGSFEYDGSSSMLSGWIYLVEDVDLDQLVGVTLRLYENGAPTSRTLDESDFEIENSDTPRIIVEMYETSDLRSGDEYEYTIRAFATYKGKDVSSDDAFVHCIWPDKPSDPFAGGDFDYYAEDDYIEGEFILAEEVDGETDLDDIEIKLYQGDTLYFTFPASDHDFGISSDGDNTVTLGRDGMGLPVPSGYDYYVTISATYEDEPFTGGPYKVKYHEPDFDFNAPVPETSCGNPADGSVTVSTTLYASHEEYSDFSFAATVTGASIIWNVDGTDLEPVTLTPPTMSVVNESTLSSGPVNYTVALPTSGSVMKYRLVFDIVETATRGSQTFSSGTMTVTSNEKGLPGSGHTFNYSASVDSPWIGSDQFNANGAVTVNYNTETGYTYSAEITQVEVSLGNGFQTVPDTNWDQDTGVDNNSGTITVGYHIHGFAVDKTGATDSCTIRISVHVTGVLGSDTYTGDGQATTPPTIYGDYD